MRVVGVDIGGTFTDFMLYDTKSEAVHVHKVRSTPDDPGRAMVTGLVELCGAAGIEPAQVDAVFHGTTVATNAVLPITRVNGSEDGLLFKWVTPTTARPWSNANFASRPNTPRTSAFLWLSMFPR